MGHTPCYVIKTIYIYSQDALQHLHTLHLGQSKRKFGTRLKEHQKTISTLDKGKSALAEHKTYIFVMLMRVLKLHCSLTTNAKQIKTKLLYKNAFSESSAKKIRKYMHRCIILFRHGYTLLQSWKWYTPIITTAYKQVGNFSEHARRKSIWRHILGVFREFIWF
jgi:hypothetical protein